MFRYALLAIALLFATSLAAEDFRGGAPGRNPPYKTGNPNDCAVTPLINSADLEAMMDNSEIDLVILDAAPGPMCEDELDPGFMFRGTNTNETYDRVHIQGAYFADWRTDWSDPPGEDYVGDYYLYEFASEATFQDLIQRHGITHETVVVIYDRAGLTPMFNRLAVMGHTLFEYYGFTNVYVLEGGLEDWLDYGGDYTLNDPVIRPVPSRLDPEDPDYDPNYSVPGRSRSTTLVTPNPAMVASFEYVRDNLDNDFVINQDARPYTMYWGYDYDADELKYGGLIHTGAKTARPGRIPGAENRFWKDQYNIMSITFENTTLGDILEAAGMVVSGPNKTIGGLVAYFKDISELYTLHEAHMTNQGIIVTSCNEAIHASLNRFVLEHMLCYPHVLIYGGSAAEWTFRPHYPGMENKTAPVVIGKPAPGVNPLP
jgi:3-mercaptopyruvate sulfurtransferase SseA